MTKFASMCFFCKHFDKSQYTFICKAYPKGIHEEIINNKVDHERSYRGDNGIVFEVKKGLEKSYKDFLEIRKELFKI